MVAAVRLVLAALEVGRLLVGVDRACVLAWWSAVQLGVWYPK